MPHVSAKHTWIRVHDKRKPAVKVDVKFVAGAIPVAPRRHEHAQARVIVREATQGCDVHKVDVTKRAGARRGGPLGGGGAKLGPSKP